MRRELGVRNCRVNDAIASANGYEDDYEWCCSSVGFFERFVSPDGYAAVVLEDNGRVAYAYLLDATGAICGDVWLYNRCPAPLEPEWGDCDRAPYANPIAFVDQAMAFSLPDSAADIVVEWSQRGCDLVACIFLSQTLLAKLMQGSKPGWSRLAVKDGPLALKLEG